MWIKSLWESSYMFSLWMQWSSCCPSYSQCSSPRMQSRAWGWRRRCLAAHSFFLWCIAIYMEPPPELPFFCGALVCRLTWNLGLNTFTRPQYTHQISNSIHSPDIKFTTLTNRNSHPGMFATPLSLSASACPLLELFLWTPCPHLDSAMIQLLMITMFGVMVLLQSQYLHYR